MSKCHIVGNHLSRLNIVLTLCRSAKEIAKLKGDIAADQNKHEAAKKVMNMKIENLEKQLEQKVGPYVLHRNDAAQDIDLLHTR